MDLPLPHLRSGFHRLTEPLLPRAGSGVGQTVREQQLQMGIVTTEHPVVEGLVINRMCTPVQEQGREIGGEGMTGLTSGPLLTFTEHPCQRGKRCRHPAPQIAGVGIGAGVEQQRGSGKRLFPGGGAACVAEVQQRLPTERSALLGNVGAGTEVTCQRIWIGRRGGGPDVGIHQLRRGAERVRGRRPPRWRVGVGVVKYREAAESVRGRQVVFIDAGSTTLACAAQLATRDVTVITHAPAIAAALVERPGVRLVTVGGQVDPEVGAALGSGVMATLDTLRPDLLLLGACGVDAEAGITAQSCEDAAVKRLIAARAARVAVAADSAKLGTAAPFSVIALAACDHLCIEAGTPAPVRDTLAAAGPILIEVET